MKNFFQIVMVIGLLLLSSLSAGCVASYAVSSKWQKTRLVIDGNDNDWLHTVQYYDKTRHVTVRFSNDHNALYLCLATQDRNLQRLFSRSGLTLKLTRNGGGTPFLEIQLPARMDGQPPSYGRQQGGTPPSRPQDEISQRADIGPHAMARLDAIKIVTGNGETGEMMSLAKARRNGIDIGIGSPDGKRLVYEFRIALATAGIASNAQLSGTVVDITFAAKASGPPAPPSGVPGSQGDVNQDTGGPGDMGGGPGGGMGGAMGGGMGAGMGPGPGGPPPAQDGSSFQLRFHVRLAGSTDQG